ncbi:SOH1-domain-containing protein [Russula vinacea]|nr:SOH1-domain-containing protein [Russula vinacea]
MVDPVKEGTDEERVKNRKRFELELEFGILYQPAFINYLKYLLYWKEKDYARFILYPHALHHLELLQHAEFRSEIMKDEWRECLNQKQFDHWRTWREPRHINPPADGNEEQDGSVKDAS